jgi:hypothetical protein
VNVTPAWWAANVKSAATSRLAVDGPEYTLTNFPWNTDCSH